MCLKGAYDQGYKVRTEDEDVIAGGSNRGRGEAYWALES